MKRVSDTLPGMTALLVLGGIALLYYLAGVLTMAFGARLLRGKGATPDSFWEAGYLWPVLLPIFLITLGIAIFQALRYWPHAPKRHP